jgi:hypothetical protein
MRRIVVVLLCLALMAGLSAQSVTISNSKLDDLAKILADYVSITKELQALSKSSATSISDLQTGLSLYEKVVDQELVPKAKAQETTIKRLETVEWILGIAIGGLVVRDLFFK